MPEKFQTPEKPWFRQKSVLALIVQYSSCANKTGNRQTTHMLNWALAFLIIALIAGLLGFTGLAGAAVGMAKILFVIFLVLFLVSLIAHRV
jgi:uncharacterized membrane protein YtjA (UPF0391 family)